VSWLGEAREELEGLQEEWHEASANGDGGELSTIGDRMFRASITIEVLEEVLEDEQPLA